jgi:membrane fusion protein, multidrug efflux system
MSALPKSSDEQRGADDARLSAASTEKAEQPTSPERDRVEKPTAGRGGPVPELIRRHSFATSLVAALFVAALAAGAVWWRIASRYVSTDDAFIDTRTVSISSQVNGAIVDVPVTDNQTIQAGEVLAKIDDRDYRAAVDQASAQVDQAQASVANLDAQIEAQRARIDQAQKQVAQGQAALTFAGEQDNRAQDLFKKGAGSQENAQQTASNLRQSQATLDAQQANLLAAQKQIAVLKAQRQVSTAQLEQERAALTQAQVNLTRTVIRAPTASSVAMLTAAKGDYAQVGQTLMMLVPQDVWVTANFKETDIGRVQPGQPVDVYIDAYPGLVLLGRIESIQAGSGAAFSLLPPENATGNYVKVVQRVPVKIVLDHPPDIVLGPGMSVEPYVKAQ